MISSRRLLLTPGELGPAEWADVSLRLTSSGHHVELAVGLGLGAGPAAAMVAEGRATSAVLIEPHMAMFAMTHPDDFEVLIPEAGLEFALEMSEQLEPFSENLKHGPMTRAMVDIPCGVFTGEPWRIRRADLVAPFLMDRLTVDRSLVPTEADRHSADWASFAADASVSVWLSAGREPLADCLRGHGVEVTVTPWGRAPWIESVEELAAAIESEVTRASTSG